MLVKNWHWWLVCKWLNRLSTDTPYICLPLQPWTDTAGTCSVLARVTWYHSLCGWCGGVYVMCSCWAGSTCWPPTLTDSAILSLDHFHSSVQVILCVLMSHTLTHTHTHTHTHKHAYTYTYSTSTQRGERDRQTEADWQAHRQTGTMSCSGPWVFQRHVCPQTVPHTVFVWEFWSHPCLQHVQAI